MSQSGRLHLTLTDTAPQVADALEAAVEGAGLADVEVVFGSLFDVGADAVVSPGNSFGFMDGGLDLACVDRFGPQVEDRVQAASRDRFHGELLVGQAVTVPTDDEALPWLISAPTMRVPMRLPADTVNPYLAMRAALLAVVDHPSPRPTSTGSRPDRASSGWRCRGWAPAPAGCPRRWLPDRWSLRSNMFATVNGRRRRPGTRRSRRTDSGSPHADDATYRGPRRSGWA